MGKIKVQDRTGRHINALVSKMHKKGLSPRTCQYVLGILRSSLGQAVKWGLIVRSPAAVVDPPRGKREEVKVYTPDEARALLAAVKGHRLEALFTVAVALGLRKGEVLALKW